MIQDLDETIAALLRRDLPPALAAQVQISFATPDDQFPSQSVTLPAIDLFLYDVRENLELRSNEVTLTRRGDGTAIRTQPAVRVDFSYLITAWPSESAPNPAEDEHRLLGEVMRVLLRYRTIPADVLQGELRDQTPALPISGRAETGPLHRLVGQPSPPSFEGAGLCTGGPEATRSARRRSSPRFRL